MTTRDFDPAGQRYEVPGVPLLTRAPGLGADAVVRPRCQPQPTGRLSVVGVARTWRHARGAVSFWHCTGTGVAPVRIGGTVAITIDDPVLCGRFALCGLRITIERRRGLMPSVCRRDASDQQRGRRAELRDAWSSANRPTPDLDRVRCPFASGPTGERRSRRSTVPCGSLDPPTGVTVDGDDVPIALPGVMGGASTEIRGHDRRHRRGLRDLRCRWPTPRTSQPAPGGVARFQQGWIPDVADRALDRCWPSVIAAQGAASLGPARSSPREPSERDHGHRPSRVGQRAVLGTSLDRSTMVDLYRTDRLLGGHRGDDSSVDILSWRSDGPPRRRHRGDRSMRTDCRDRADRSRVGPPARSRRRSTPVGVRALWRVPVSGEDADAVPGPWDPERRGLPPAGSSCQNRTAAEESVLRRRCGRTAADRRLQRQPPSAGSAAEIGRVFETGEGVAVDVAVGSPGGA